MVKPVNLDALNKWVGQLPPEVVDNMANIAPMLARLGYDPFANPPNYGQVFFNFFFFNNNNFFNKSFLYCINDIL